MSESISDILALLSLLFAIIALWFSIGFPKIESLLEQEIPTVEKKNARGVLRAKIIRIFINVYLPLLLSSLVISFLIHPLIINILRTSSFDFCEFDTKKSLVCAMGWFLFYLVFMLLRIGVQLLKKYKLTQA